MVIKLKVLIFINLLCCGFLNINAQSVFHFSIVPNGDWENYRESLTFLNGEIEKTVFVVDSIFDSSDRLFSVDTLTIAEENYVEIRDCISGFLKRRKISRKKGVTFFLDDDYFIDTKGRKTRQIKKYIPIIRTSISTE